MTPVECPFESEVLSAVIHGAWPDRVEADLRHHVDACPICADVAAVGATLYEDGKQLRAAAALPGSGRVWWLAQLRARREASAAAARTINVAVGAALICTLAVVCALLPVQEWMFGLAQRIGWSRMAAVAAVALALIFIPAAACLALSRD